MSNYLNAHGVCLLIRTVWLFLSLLKTISGLLNFCSRPLAGLLNSSVAMLGKLGPIGADIISNKTIFIYLFI